MFVATLRTVFLCFLSISSKKQQQKSIYAAEKDMSFSIWVLFDVCAAWFEFWVQTVKHRSVFCSAAAKKTNLQIPYFTFSFSTKSTYLAIAWSLDRPVSLEKTKKGKSFFRKMKKSRITSQNGKKKFFWHPSDLFLMSKHPIWFSP